MKRIETPRGQNVLRRIDGRIAVEFKLDSGFSHLVYLTSEQLDGGAEAAECTVEGDHEVSLGDLGCVPQPGFELDDRRAAFERLVDQLRDLIFEGCHESREPIRSSGEEQLDSESSGHAEAGTLTAPLTVVLGRAHLPGVEGQH